MAAKRLSGLDTVFLSAESPGAWLHVMAILILDPHTVPGGYSFDRMSNSRTVPVRPSSSST